MSNEQWNQGQGPEGAPQQPQPKGNSWTQPQDGAQEWSQPQPQRSAQEWTQAQPQQSAGGWQQAQPQQAQPQGSAQEWTQNQWDWDQNQTQSHQQSWDQNQQWGGQGWDQNQQQWGQQQQQWGQQGQEHLPANAGSQQWAQQGPKDPSPFDFSFTKPSLPGAAGLIFLVGTIGIAAWWLFNFLSQIVYAGDFLLSFFATTLGNLGLAVFGIMMLRAVLEVAVALYKPKDADDVAAEGERP